MRIAAVAIAFFLLICFACLISNDYTDRTMDSLLDKLDRCENEILQGRWNDALDTAYYASSLWHDARPVLAAFMRHEELDDITKQFCRVIEYASARNLQQFLVESACLSEGIEHIKHLDSPIAANIL